MGDRLAIARLRAPWKRRAAAWAQHCWWWAAGWIGVWSSRPQPPRTITLDQAEREAHHFADTVLGLGDTRQRSGRPRPTPTSLPGDGIPTQR